MPWQLPPDHAEALRHPPRCFHDNDLKRSQLATGPDGNPLSHGGQWADIYQARSLFGPQRWALKRYRTEAPGRDYHYRALAEHLLRIDLPCLVPFQYLESGLCVRGRWFPVLKMQWVDGVRLNTYVRDAAERPAVLHRLAQLWAQLAIDLRRVGVAHGALQHGNVLVVPGPDGKPAGLRLVDYDAMFVPSRKGSQPLQGGHPNYQHPQRLWQQTYDADADRFPHLLVYTALVALIAGGRDLWERHDAGDNFLFKESDFSQPATSAIFRELWRSSEPAVRSLTGQLLLASQGKGDAIPALEDLAAVGRSSSAGPGEVAPFALGGEQKLRVETLLGHDVERPRSAQRPARSGADRRNTFGLLVEDEEGADASPLHAALDDNFDLVVEDDPNAILPPALPSGPPALPVVPVVAVAPPPVPQDPNALTYHLEAWMPEQVAVMKVQGFVDSATGRVVTSEPGFMRVHLLDPYDLVQPSRPGLLGWLGFVEQSPPVPAVLAVVEFEMCEKPTAHKKLLAITVRISPGDHPPVPGSRRWRGYCDKVYCEIRGYFMGIVSP